MNSNLNNTLALLDELEAALPQDDVHRVAVSKSTVGWQIDHSCIVINKIAEGIPKSDPSNFKSGFNFWKTVCLGLAWFPRGKARAPKFVLPLETPATQEELQAAIEQARKSVKSFETLATKNYMKHPMFGMLDRDTTARFIYAHTKHHVKIIRDILAA